LERNLETAATLLDAQMERLLHAEHTYTQFLDELLTSEQQERGRNCEEMRTNLARLPHRKSLGKC
jgi:DNA replication protein DnaC